jgi:hypothetical protein
MSLFIDAARKGIDVKTEQFLKAAGLRKAKNAAFLMYKEDPLIALGVYREHNAEFSGKLSPSRIKKLKGTYEKTLGRFGWKLIRMEALDGMATSAVVLEYKNLKKPYVRVLSAIFFGFDKSKTVTITYSIDAYSWTGELDEKVNSSFASFSPGKGD